MSSLTAVSAALLSIAALAGCAQDGYVQQGGPGDCATSARSALHEHGIERGQAPMTVKACRKTSIADAATGVVPGTVR